jgi:ribosome-binding protein aMBF1 (putative translation factor)
MRKYPGRRRAVINALQEARETAGLSQRALSAKLKEAPTYVHEIEAGQHSVRVEEFIAIAEALGVEPVELLKRVLRKP